jgi:nicotinamidase-related amidase
MSADTALVVIDAQIGVVGEAYHHDEVLSRARTSGTPVLYVQHNEPKGGELEPGTPKWSLHPTIAPRAGELVVQKESPCTGYLGHPLRKLDCSVRLSKLSCHNT